MLLPQQMPKFEKFHLAAFAKILDEHRTIIRHLAGAGHDAALSQVIPLQTNIKDLCPPLGATHPFC